VACAVTLYEAYRQKSNAGHYNQKSMNDVRYNELLKEWGFREDVLGLIV
jgi:tRNA (guanosine-2'-O-)-methyltransferase